MEDLTGKQLGPYQIVAPLGEGGMAAVYKAYQPAMERYVALKILPRHFASDPQFVGRFQQEAKVLARLQHPHILPVHDFGEADGYTYIVMPFVESGTLSDWLRGQPLGLEQIRRIISQVGDALDYAHTRGLVHRDVKPSNILIDERGNCLLTDFGIAKIVEGAVKLTQTGGIIGTPAYMSPEQGLGQKVDARSDIYALGVILYELVTGRPPYDAETPLAVIVKHINDPLPLPRSLNPALPEAVERVILKALAKQPQERYRTAGDMVQALQATLPDQASSATMAATPPLPSPPVTQPDQAVQAAPTAVAPPRGAVELPRLPELVSAPPATVKPKSRSGALKAGLIVGAAALVLVVAGIGVILAGLIKITPPPPATPELQPTSQATTELIPDWQAIGGSWTGPDENGLVSGKTAAFDGDALYLFKNTYSDFWFSAAVQALNREASLAVRMSDDGQNGYLVIFVPTGSKGGNPGLWLAKRVQGDHTFPAFFKADYPVGEWLQLTVEARGPRITVLLNKDVVIDFEDEANPFTSGRLGFRCYGEPTAPCEANFANFSLSH